jgi:hypothetical protein
MTECKDDLEWHGLYGKGEAKYKRYFDATTNAHPAKMSKLLCNKIIQHLEEIELLKKGDKIVDFMNGIGTTGVIATLNGYDYIGIELEDHFIKMTMANKAQLEKQINRKAKWEIIKGDSRHLSELLSERGAGITSPPYADTEARDRSKEDSFKREAHYQRGDKNISAGYTAITSPPYGDAIARRGGDIKLEHIGISQKTAREYSQNPTNIGNLKDKPLTGLTSPPYGLGKGIGHNGKGLADKVRYGEEQANIGNDVNESYLSAMLQVYQEAYNSGISPLALVTKNPTKAGKLRRLDEDTIKLCEGVGYHLHCRHRAILWEWQEQKQLDGEIKRVPKGRISFFKRLSLQKGSIAAQWEDVLIFEK